MALTAQDRLTFQAAEDAFAGGRYEQALAGFHGYLRRRLEMAVSDDAYRAPDAIAIDRLADLSSHLAGGSAAEDLLEGLVTLYRRAGNPVSERLTILRLAHLQLRRGAVRLSYETLGRLAH